MTTSGEVEVGVEMEVPMVNGCSHIAWLEVFYSHNFCTLLQRTQAKQKKEDPDRSTNINFKFIGKLDDLDMRVEFMLLTARKNFYV